MGRGGGGRKEPGIMEKVEGVEICNGKFGWRKVEVREGDLVIEQGEGAKLFELNSGSGLSIDSVRAIGVVIRGGNWESELSDSCLRGQSRKLDRIFPRRGGFIIIIPNSIFAVTTSFTTAKTEK